MTGGIQYVINHSCHFIILDACNTILCKLNQGGDLSEKNNNE